MVSGCMRRPSAAAVLGVVLFLVVETPAFSQLAEQVAAKAVPTVRVTGKIDPAVRTTLKGHVPPAVRSAVDLGRVDAGTPLPHMIMVLSSSADQEHALRSLIDQQNDKNAESYHRWETPESFQNKFGASDADLASVTDWLAAQGFTIEQVAKGGRIIQFGATVGSFEAAFQTEFHRYQLGSEQHIAINSDISVPSALASVVLGVPTVHDFFKKSGLLPSSVQQFSRSATGLIPLYTSGSTHYVSPQDFATIYNSAPLISAGTNGSGVTIGVVGRSDIGLNDVQAYRQLFNLPNNNPNFVVAGEDPGTAPGDDVESDLDVEVAGGVAPGATVDFVTAKSTLTVDGIDLAMMYAVQNNLADVISESYGACEADLGAVGMALNTTLREQAAAQGISVFVSSGDNGPAACDASTETYETLGYAVNGDAATPYNVAVGGSEFIEGTGTYWATRNAAGDSSASSYIPEYPWNEARTNSYGYSGDASGLWSGGGGISAYFATPSWQRGYGVPTADPAYQGFSLITDPAKPVAAGPHRYLPDVVLNAASGHDGTLFCSEGNCEISAAGALAKAGVVGGTSVAAPEMAGVQALIDQENGGRQGLPTYQYYALSTANHTAGLACGSSTATKPAAGCTFHDITAGSNLICAEATCATNGYSDEMGWTAGAGYDLASGLGSPNVDQLAIQWSSVIFASSVTNLTMPATGATHGTPSTLQVTVAPGSATGTPTGQVAFYTTKGSITTPISADTGEFTNQGPLCTLSGGSCTIQLSSLPAGSTGVIARYAGDGTFGSSVSAPVAVNISSEASVVSLAADAVNCTTGAITKSTSFPYGSLIYLDAGVAGASGQGVPTGAITITDGSATLSTQTLNPNGAVEMVSGVISSTSCVYGYSFNNLAPLSGGAHVLSASYAGDSNYAASKLASPIAVTVTPVALTTALVATSTEIAAGSADNLILTMVPLAAAAQAAAPTGTATFVDTTTGATLGMATIGGGIYAGNAYTLAPLSTTLITKSGAHSIKATYSGDANYAASSATATVTVGGKAIGSITLTSTATSFAVSTANTLTATIAPPSGGATATGTVYFFDGATMLGTAGLASGKATLATAKLLAAGSHSITANYAGNATYDSARSTALAITVAQATPTLTMAAPLSVLPGTTVSLATVLSATTPSAALVDFPPTGTVQFYDGTTAIGPRVSITTVPAANGGYGLYEATTSISTLAIGAHKITAVLTDTNYAPTASYAQTVKVYGSPIGNLEVAVDSTTSQTTIPVTDKLYVGGWAADPTDGSPLTNVKVYLDGVSIGSPTLGQSRPDVATYYNNPAYSNSGFSLIYALTSVTAGTHSVTAVATNGYGISTTLGKLAITVDYAAPIGNLEVAADEANSATTIPTTDSLFVGGWIADPFDGSPLANVKVYLDGVAVGTPTLGIKRTDVSTYYNNTKYAKSGFSFIYPAYQLKGGTHTVTVVGINSHSVSTTLGPRTITVTVVNRPPVGNLEKAVDSVTGKASVSKSKGALWISGWAADYQDNGPAKQVQILMDGVAVGNATLGVARTDVESSFKNPAMLNTGYILTMPATSLSVGTHKVTSIATDSLSLSTTFGPLTITITP